jgi:REP element-mobilizing transposase RayT
MGKKYRNKYRIQSHRMPGWDYGGNGLYFITLVTQNRECHLGEIVNGDGQKIMDLSDFGRIVQTEWEKSFTLRDELSVDEYIIMPNHLHAIIVLEKRDDNGTDGMDGMNGTHGWHVETHGRASLQGHSHRQSQKSQPSEKSPFTRKPKSISSFIAGFKSAVISKIDDYIDEHRLDIPKYNRQNHFFQSNYYDRIIRNEQEYQRIKKYIINNPAKWMDDNFNMLMQHMYSEIE